jgi:hypothetical protein
MEVVSATSTLCLRRPGLLVAPGQRIIHSAFARRLEGSD